jgi:hypothetical protein
VNRERSEQSELETMKRNAWSKNAYLVPRWCAKGAMALLFILTAIAAQAQSNLPSEYQLKAAFLFNFAKFIEWPQHAFPSPQSPFNICVFGKDPFGSSLDEALADKKIGDRSILIQRPKDKLELRHCQIAFVSSSETERVNDIVEGLQGVSVLLVGESEGFAESGGTIEFTLEQGHVRFSINPDAAEHANLRLSSKLLALAKIIHGTAHPRGG